MREAEFRSLVIIRAFYPDTGSIKDDPTGTDGD